MDLKLTKFDTSSMKDDKVIVLIGKRETGKSVLVKDLLYYQKNIHIGTVTYRQQKVQIVFTVV